MDDPWSNFSLARVKSPPIACTQSHKCINLDAKGLNSSRPRMTKACPEIFVHINGCNIIFSVSSIWLTYKCIIAQ